MPDEPTLPMRSYRVVIRWSSGNRTTQTVRATSEADALLVVKQRWTDQERGWGYLSAMVVPVSKD